MEPEGSPLVWAGFAFAYGLAVGSFLNVVVYRLPEGLSVVSPGSRCPGCGHAIRARDNIPVLSYLLLRGRCRGCGQPISLRYPTVELATGLLFAAVALRFGASWATPLFCIFAALLLAAALIDFDHQIIPDEISVGGLGAGLLLAPLAFWADAGRAGYTHAFVDSLVGAAIGGGLLWSVGFFHARLSVALGREFEHWPGEGEELPRFWSADYWLWFPGLGLGDVKLLAMIGAFVGPWGVLETILCASFMGLALGLGHAALTRSFASPFGFGPAIAGGAFLALFAPLRAWVLGA